MATADLLQALATACKCEVSVSINGHRNYYESIERHLESVPYEQMDIDPEVRAEMIRRDTIVNVIAYDKTPVGSFHVVHYDLDTALRRMLTAVTSER